MSCETEDQYAQFMLSRATLPPLTFGDTLHWDGGAGADSQGVELPPGAALDGHAVLSIHGQQDAGLSQTCRRGVGVFSPQLPVPAIDWARAVASFIFYLDPILLLPSPSHAVFPAVTGTLLWVRGQEEGASITPAVHPALLVQTAAASRQMAYVALVPHVPCDDPLQHHITTVLQAAVAAEDRASQFYAESLANALADHLLRRYAACRLSERVCSGGFPPFKLQRTIVYIRAHLEHALSLSELAAVTQMSP